MRISFIVGLPASGKTSLALKMLNESLKGHLIDDPKTQEDLLIPLGTQHLIITDPCLCIDSNRYAAYDHMRADYEDCEIEFIFFANDPVQCQKNALRRVNKPVESLIRQLSKVYTPPRIDKPVWRPEL